MMDPSETTDQTIDSPIVNEHQNANEDIIPQTLAGQVSSIALEDDEAPAVQHADAVPVSVAPPVAGAAAPISKPAPGGVLFEITVSDPVKQGEGMNAYVSYKINTKTDHPKFEYAQFSVVRRYSDFVWLRGVFVKTYPGIIVPPLPEKLVVGRFSEEFVEGRRRALQKFLERVAAHAILRDADNFQTFLEANESNFSSAKSKTKGGKETKTFWQWASETSHNIQSKLAPTEQREKTEEDILFDEVSAYVSGLEAQMANVHKHTQNLINRGRDTASGLFEVGLAFTLLGQVEADSLGSGLARLGHCADKLSVLAAEESEKEALYFEDPLKDYVRIVGAVRMALNERQKRMHKYEQALTELQTKKNIAARLTKQPGKAERVPMAQQEVINAQKKVDSAKKVFDEVTTRVLGEVERFKKEKLVDFKKIILDYVQLQIEFNRKIEESWKSVLPELEAIDVDGGKTVAKTT